MIIAIVDLYAYVWYNIPGTSQLTDSLGVAMTTPGRVLPAIRVAVTEVCNLRCQYCPEDGDSVQMQACGLNNEGFETLLTAACEVGFKSFSFTGGDPLATPEAARRTFILAQLVNRIREGLGYTK